jgi:molecular chaperone GrpE
MSPLESQSNDNSAGAEPAEMAAPELEQLRQDLAMAQDRALRAQADLENYRKRMRREMDEERRYAQLPLIRDVLPVLDNIALALKAADAARDGAAAEGAGLVQGVRMVAQQLEGALKQHGLQRVAAEEGGAFDPHLHEAVGARPNVQHPSNTVLEVLRAGYQLHDRVVRPAQVVVSQAPE